MQLSIIVPVYNMAAGGKLEYCIQSLLKQELTDYEIIAVDDSSTDDSLDVLKRLQQENPQKLKVIVSPENRRQGGAKNLGLQEAIGDWIGFVDSDDWVAKDMYAKLLWKAGETGADVVGCNYLVTDQTGKEKGIAVPNNSPAQTGVMDEQKYRDCILNPGSMVIKIYKRAIFQQENIVFPEKIFYEDNAIGVLPLLYAKRFERVEEELYFYYQHDASTVHTIDMERCKNRLEAMEIYKKQCMDRGFYEKYKQEIDYKIYELGYRNTLFSYVQTQKHPSHSFVELLRSFLLENVPQFHENPYYQKLVDDETKKLVGIHKKSTFLFLLYYKALFLYRKLRYSEGKGRGNKND